MQNNKNQIIEYFQEKKVLTIDELKNILNTSSRMTIFRRLSSLNYITSYSHCGRYYTLNSIVDYDTKGLWSYNQVYFSKFGTLKNTILSNINKSPAGFTCEELQGILKVPVHNTAHDLWKNGLITREQIARQYLYLSIENKTKQLNFRKQEIVKKNKIASHATSMESFTVFFSLLNEKQKRLFAGYESIKLGYGGDKIVAEKTGLNKKTVSRGRRELLSKDIDVDRIRKKGAGRPSLKKTKEF